MLSIRSRCSARFRARTLGARSGGDAVGRHPRRVGEFGIVVVAQDLVEVPRGGPVRVDVRVRVEDRPAAHLVEQLAGRRVVRQRSSSSISARLDAVGSRAGRIDAGIRDRRADLVRLSARRAIHARERGAGPDERGGDRRRDDRADRRRPARSPTSRRAGSRRRSPRPACAAGRRSGTSTPRRPSSRSSRLARFDLDAADPAAELARLDAPPRRLARRAATASTSSRSAEGTVADYAGDPRARSSDDRPIDVAFLAMAVSDFEPEPVAGKLDSDAESLVDPLPAARPR